MESQCSKAHMTIEEAVRHAEEGLGGQATLPYWGRGYRPLRAGESRIHPTNVPNLPVERATVVGFAINDQKRWHLDYDDKGIHVNEEILTSGPGARKTRHSIAVGSFVQVDAYWRKWTSRHRNKFGG